MCQAHCTDSPAISKNPIRLHRRGHDALGSIHESWPFKSPFLTNNFPVRVILTPQDSSLLTSLGQRAGPKLLLTLPDRLNKASLVTEPSLTTYLLEGIARSEFRFRQQTALLNATPIKLDTQLFAGSGAEVRLL